MNSPTFVPLSTPIALASSNTLSGPAISSHTSLKWLASYSRRSSFGAFLHKDTPALFSLASQKSGSSKSSSYTSNNVSMHCELPLVGNKAPDFTADSVFDYEFGTVRLSDYIGKKYVILFFYPFDFTFVCPTEITAFSDAYQSFKDLDTEIIGCSIDSKFVHLAWLQTERKEGGLGELNYPLIADVKHEIAKAYRVLTDEGCALRGLFIIDKQGVIQHSTINNLAFGRSVDETLRTLQAIQYVQNKTDEVCPANWKPGDPTISPDPKKSKEYFSQL